MINGACVQIEEALGRPVLWLACRHHVMEIILKDVFGVCCGRQNGPDIPIFKRFKERWDSLDQSNFKTIIDEEPLSYFYEQQRQEIIQYLQD